MARSAFLAEALTERARYKVKVIDWHNAHGKNISLCARHFGISRATLHRWLLRLNQHGILGLNEQSRKPKKVRVPTIPSYALMRTVELKKQYPAWSKYKIKTLLQKEGIALSASSIGRIFKRRGLIKKKDSQRRRKAALRPKARFPQGLRISEPGDMLQIDVKHIMLPRGRKFYQFTAIDVLSKHRILRVYPSESSRNGALFLRECLNLFPFPVKAVQTDNGASFLKEFEKLCKELNLPHYFIYPHCPKQNTYVETSHGADKREFYQQGNVCSLLSVMQRKIKEWEYVWNNVRPHESLGYLTPNEYLRKLEKHRLPTRDFIVLQT